MEQFNPEATNYLNNLKRVEKIANDIDSYDTPILLFPHHAELVFTLNSTVETRGLGRLDLECKDLLTHIKILDPLNVEYLETNVLMPRTYAESLSPIPHHISIQAIVFSRVNKQSLDQVFKLLQDTEYNKTNNDRIWVEDNDPASVMKPGEVIIVMNRRVGGWDGNQDRPVIELLGGGGHLPTIWDKNERRFVQMDPVNAIIKEIKEELRYSLSPDDVKIIGGFQNDVSNELVILCLVFVPFGNILDIQRGALNNLDQNTDGIYLGTLKGVLKRYLENAETYAGGEKAKTSNFPSRPELMNRVYAYLKIDG